MGTFIGEFITIYVNEFGWDTTEFVVRNQIFVSESFTRNSI